MKPQVAAIFALFNVLALSRAFHLECSFITSLWYSPGNTYVCWTPLTQFPANDLNITSVGGSHEPGKTNADVRGLFVPSSATLASVPRGASKFFPNITLMFLQSTVIEELRGSELQEYPQLRVFAVVYSNLTAISSRLFESTPHLTDVAFYRNKLGRVGSNLFRPLNVAQLREVDFRYNPCIDVQGKNNQTAIAEVIAGLKSQCQFAEEEQESCELDEVAARLRADMLALKEALLAEVRAIKEEILRALAGHSCLSV